MFTVLMLSLLAVEVMLIIPSLSTDLRCESPCLGILTSISLNSFCYNGEGDLLFLTKTCTPFLIMPWIGLGEPWFTLISESFFLYDAVRFEAWLRTLELSLGANFDFFKFWFETFEALTELVAALVAPLASLN